MHKKGPLNSRPFPSVEPADELSNHINAFTTHIFQLKPLATILYLSYMTCSYTILYAAFCGMF
jgi:hypothetical protein